MSRPSSDPLTCHGTPGFTSARGTRPRARAAGCRRPARRTRSRGGARRRRRAARCRRDRRRRPHTRSRAARRRAPCPTARRASRPTRPARLTSLLRTSLASSSSTFRSASRAFAARRHAGRRGLARCRADPPREIVGGGRQLLDDHLDVGDRDLVGRRARARRRPCRAPHRAARLPASRGRCGAAAARRRRDRGGTAAPPT